MIERIFITIFTRLPLGTLPNLEHLLEAFENDKSFRPTRWGPGDRGRLPYDRAEMLKVVSASENEYRTPTLTRTKRPAYEAFFSIRNRSLNYIDVTFEGPAYDEAQGIFDLGELLAKELNPEFGIVHPICTENSQEYSATGVISKKEFVKCGPAAICARTWFGSHMVELIGRARLEASTGILSEMPEGGIQLDLVEQPWGANMVKLPARQAEVMKHLQSSGVFGDYSSLIECKPGPQFVRITDW